MWNTNLTDAGNIEYLARLRSGHSGVPASMCGVVCVVPFLFSSSSPMILGAVPAGYLFDRSSVLIETAFDDPSATVSFGTSADPGLLLRSADIRAFLQGQYDSEAIAVLDVGDVLLLTVQPGVSTQGSGLLLYRALPP